ncbi:LacI family DNA-binding transcriptional regulator [Micrococcaceae bacterium Sec5.7]
MTRVSISDVAFDVGVSETTVSHALSGRRHVAEATIVRVREASERLGYRPSQVARSLRTRRTYTTALIVPDLCNPFYPSLARGLQDVLFERGYQTLICDADSRPDREEKFFDEVIERQVDGVVIAPLLGTVPSRILTAPELAVVVINSSQRGPKLAIQADTVSTNDEAGMMLAARHLIRKGHRRIGYITAPMHVGPAQRRFDGFRRALRQAGYQYDDGIVAATTFTREGGFRGLEQIMRAPNPPTAVLCANDLIAIGAMDLAAARNIRIPDDLAVVGYDDIEPASLVSPRLTTVQIPTRDIGKASGDLLVGRMTGAYRGRPREVQIENTLITRDST